MTDETIIPGNESEVNDLLQKKEFGAVLKKARKKTDLSVSDVAENLLISVDIIKALEDSQADALPALTFTQGYIRSYARLLGVSADEIISDYVKMAPGSKQVLTPHSVLPVQKSSSDIFMRLISLSFVICAIVILVFWLYETDFKMGAAITKNISEFNAPEVKQQQAEVTNEASVESQLPGSIEQPVKLVQDDDVITADNQIEPVATQVEQAPVKVEPVPVGDELPHVDELLLSALSESWCEIQDSTGKRIFYQLLNRGQDIKLSGVAPFTVFLGNAPGVRVEVNNTIVNFESLINKTSNIANIKISKNAAVVGLSNR